MSNASTYNQVIDRLSKFAAGHYYLRSFTHGQIDLAEPEKFPEFPWMHAAPDSVTFQPGGAIYSFNILFFDLPRDKEDKPGYQKEAISDMAQVAGDLIYEITNGLNLFGDDVIVNGQPVFTVGIQEYTNVLTGGILNIAIEVPNEWNACDIPATYVYPGGNDPIVPNPGDLVFAMSLVNDDGTVTLVNDEETPGNSYYYGTNGAGVKGWYLLSAGSGAVDSVNGQTGVVVLDAGDVGADTAGSAAAALVSANLYTDTEIGLINFPVDSVNGQIETVVLSAADVGADPSGSAAAAQAFSIQRANHTGTQLASTISDFAATVRATVLTGLAAGADAPILAADTILAALANLQAQITASTPPTNWAASSNIVGWSIPLTDLSIYYTRNIRSKEVTLVFILNGTSDNSTTEFDLPIQAFASVAQNGNTWVTNNGTPSTTPGRWNIAAGGTKITFTQNRNLTAFSATGTKIVFGSATYFGV